MIRSNVWRRIGLLALVVLLAIAIASGAWWLTQDRASVQACDAVRIGELVLFQAEGRLEAGDCVQPLNGDPRFADLYEFRLARHVRVRVSLESEVVNPFLLLTEADGGRWIAEDDGGSGLNARIDLELPAGAYRLHATKVDAGSGTYQLRLAVFSPEPPSSARFTQVSAGGSHMCGLTTAGAIRCWGAGGGGTSMGK